MSLSRCGSRRLWHPSEHRKAPTEGEPAFPIQVAAPNAGESLRRRLIGSRRIHHRFFFAQLACQKRIFNPLTRKSPGGQKHSERTGSTATCGPWRRCCAHPLCIGDCPTQRSGDHNRSASKARPPRTNSRARFAGLWRSQWNSFREAPHPRRSRPRSRWAASFFAVPRLSDFPAASLSARVIAPQI